jgi:UDP-glucose 4-epimerase
VLRHIAAQANDRDITSSGTLFYASSAGGVYGGSSVPPFDESTSVAPISPYGVFKVAAERLVTRFAASSGVSSLIGRIANLYGPGQSLEKMQGLISHLARAQFAPGPASIYVPLDTMRDYIYVDDCAELVLDALERLEGETAGDAVTKVLASGRAVTIGDLLGHIRLLTKRRANAMIGWSALASRQAVDLRLKSVVWPDLDARSLTTLPAGIRATMDDIFARIQHPV